MKRIPLLLAAALFAACNDTATSPDVATDDLLVTSFAKVPKIDICHYDEDQDRYFAKAISASAEEDHRAHGDAMVGEAVPNMEGYVFGEDCQPVESDNEPPVPPEPPADLYLQCAADVPDPVDLTATDNVDGDITVSPTDQETPGSNPNNFTILRTWTFTDLAGNSSSVDQFIAVDDNMAPVPPAGPADVIADTPADVPPTIDLTATDNCDGPITVSSTQTETPYPDGSSLIVRTWTFTDVAGNFSTVSQKIGVLDTHRLFAIAYSDLSSDWGLFLPGTDHLIAKLRDANDNGVPDAGDEVVTALYPTSRTPTASDFASFGKTSHMVASVTYSAAGISIVTTDGNFINFDSTSDFEQYREKTGDLVYDSIFIDWFISGYDDQILVNIGSPSQPPVGVNNQGAGPGDQGFIDVQVTVPSS